MDNYEDMPVFEEPDFLQSEPPAAPAKTVAQVAQMAAPTLQEFQRPLPGGAHSSSFINDIEQQYMLIFGNSMSAETRKVIYSIMQLNNIKSNDAALSMMLFNLHIAEKFNLMPYNVDLIQSKAVRDILKAGEKIVQDESNKAALKFTEKVNAMIEEKAGGKNSKWYDLPWATLGVVVGSFLVGNCFPTSKVTKFVFSLLF